MSSATLLFVLVVGVVGVATLVAYIWVKDPFKTSLGSCLSSLAILTGSLGIPEIHGALELTLDIGFASIHSNAVQISTATPSALWITAFVSIVLLTAMFATFLFFRTRSPSSRPVTSTGSLGGEVF